MLIDILALYFFLKKTRGLMRIPKASEFFIIGLDQEELNSKELALLKNNSLGGVILFKRNISSLSQVVALNSAIIDESHTCPLISVDQEGGRVARLRGICTDLPTMLELNHAFLKDPKLSYRIGAMQGRELVALGFNLNFSPVVDVFSNPLNEVIGDRAFSKIPEEVAHFTSEYIKGLQGSGIAACAKHFPGHGRTSIDSHFALPESFESLDVLSKHELIPFKSAIAADVATIMTAHILNHALDFVPATMSSKTLSDLLRRDLGFGNVIISDDLEMKAVADNYDLAQIIEQGFRASVDMFIMGHDLAKNQEAIGILQHLIDTDEEIKSKSVQAAERIGRLRDRYLGKPKAPDLEAALQMVRSRPHLDLLA